MCLAVIRQLVCCVYALVAAALIAAYTLYRVLLEAETHVSDASTALAERALAAIVTSATNGSLASAAQ